MPECYGPEKMRGPVISTFSNLNNTAMQRRNMGTLLKKLHKYPYGLSNALEHLFTKYLSSSHNGLRFCLLNQCITESFSFQGPTVFAGRVTMVLRDRLFLKVGWFRHKSISSSILHKLTQTYFAYKRII